MMQTKKLAILHGGKMQDGKNLYQGKLFPVTEGQTTNRRLGVAQVEAAARRTSGTEPPKFCGYASLSHKIRCRGVAGLRRVFVLLHLIGNVAEMQSNIVEETLIYSSDYLIGKGIHFWLIFLEWPKVLYSDLI